MFYRVVMQGRTVGGADLAAVKREFVRVTGLPVNVADDMFGGMPKVIKRKLAEADAERIVGTLRAIGAAATIEREVGVVEKAPTTATRASTSSLHHSATARLPSRRAWSRARRAPPRKRMQWMTSLRRRRPSWSARSPSSAQPCISRRRSRAGYRAFARRRRPPPSAAARVDPGAATIAAVALNASLVHGPWRCVDQHTGLGVYWNYGSDGALVFHGDVLSDRSAASSAAANGWHIEGNKLLHRHPRGEVDAFNVSVLTLSRMRYVGERGLEIECRRP